jgi:serine O-acetyltransferase
MSEHSPATDTAGPFDGRIALVNGAWDATSVAALARYLATQLDHFSPCGTRAQDQARILTLLPAALDRMAVMLRAVRCFTPDIFNCHHSLQYAAFLYLLAHENARDDEWKTLSERLFFLNRALNAIDLYHAVEMPPVFFISHGLGAVLGNARYGNNLVVFQNVTVGRVGDARPTIGDNVVLYPGAMVTGATVIGNNCVVSAGTQLHNAQVPDNVLVRSEGGKPVFTPHDGRYIDLYLRRDDETA